MNRDRENDRLYATLLQPTATLLVEDKIMPNAPTAEISVMNHRQNNGAVRVSNQSTAGEWSVEMHQVISGERTLSLTVRKDGRAERREAATESKGELVDDGIADRVGETRKSFGVGRGGNCLPGASAGLCRTHAH